MYFGIRPRVPRSLLAGIMWFSYDNRGGVAIRHSCRHDDHLPQYGWIRHDGTSYGQEKIVDRGMSWRDNKDIPFIVIIIIFWSKPMSRGSVECEINKKNFHS